jgi:dihydroorotase
MKIPLLNDMHVHLRQGQMLRKVIRHTAKRCNSALVMPNTLPPILSTEDVHRYFREIIAANDTFRPLMTCKLVPSTTPEMIRELKGIGVTAFKLYPEGVTINSEDGIGRDDLCSPSLNFMDQLAEIEQQGMVLCLHGEMPGVFCLDRETAFLPFVIMLLSNYPKLKVVLEHITTKEAVDFVNSVGSYRLAATITAHHLFLTLDDVIGDKIQPHHFCKPVAKRKEDRAALVDAALQGNPWFFFGSDSAPHDRSTKECSSGCAGVYTAPVMLELLLQFFDEAGRMDRLLEFGTVRACIFYDMTINTPTVEVTKEPWTVPQEFDGVVPFFAGKQIKWRLA